MASERTITIGATIGGATVGGELPAWIHVSLCDAAGKATGVSEQQVRLEPAAQQYVLKATLDDGNYTVRIDTVADGFQAPAATPIVALASDTTAASVSFEFAKAAPAAEPKLQPWLSAALAAAVAAATGFWVVVLALPARADNGIPGATLAAFLIPGGLLALVGIQFLVLGLLAELTTRVYYEIQDKPIYVVRETIEAGETTET